MEREDHEEIDAHLPDGWIEALHAKADFERSFAALGGDLLLEHTNIARATLVAVSFLCARGEPDGKIAKQQP